MMKKFLILALVTTATGAADAGILGRVGRGLELLATPSGQVFATGDGGLANGARNGRVDLSRNTFGRGYELQFDRSFGADTRGRPEILDLGLFEMELNGSVQMTAGFTTRGFLAGDMTAAANNLQYSLRAKTGAQDGELRGTLNVANSVEINQFGFYDMTINVSNTNSEFLVDGVIVRDSQPTNFDVGPIVVQGNIFADMLVAALGGLGVDTSGYAQLFPRSPIDTLLAGLQDQLERDTIVAGTTLSNEALLAGFDDFTSKVSLRAAGVNAPAGTAVAVPEPMSLLLVAAGLAMYRRRR